MVLAYRNTTLVHFTLLAAVSRKNQRNKLCLHQPLQGHHVFLEIGMIYDEHSITQPM